MIDQPATGYGLPAAGQGQPATGYGLPAAKPERTAQGCNLPVKRGSGNWRYRPVGSIIIRRPTKTRRRPHVLVKVADHGPEALRWRYLSVVVWEHHHGPVPEGFCLWHRDGNSLNCADKNLELIIKAERLKRNMAANYETWLKANRPQAIKNGKQFWRAALDARRIKAWKRNSGTRAEVAEDAEEKRCW